MSPPAECQLSILGEVRLGSVPCRMGAEVCKTSISQHCRASPLMLNRFIAEFSTWMVSS